MYAANIFISKAIRATREMITKRISGQQKQPGSFILQAEPLSRSYQVAESICRIYNSILYLHTDTDTCMYICILTADYTVKTVLSGHSKKKIAYCRSKVLQNAPKGAFCNTFDLY